MKKMRRWISGVIENYIIRILQENLSCINKAVDGAIQRSVNHVLSRANLDTLAMHAIQDSLSGAVDRAVQRQGTDLIKDALGRYVKPRDLHSIYQATADCRVRDMLAAAERIGIRLANADSFSEKVFQAAVCRAAEIVADRLEERAE